MFTDCACLAPFCQHHGHAARSWLFPLCLTCCPSEGRASVYKRVRRTEEEAGNVYSGKWCSLPDCSGCETPQPPKASLKQAGREAVLCSDGCSADSTLQEGEGKEMARRQLQNSGHLSWWGSVGSADAWLGGLARRQAGSCPRLHGDKSIKKKPQKTKGVVFAAGELTPCPWQSRAEVTSGSCGATGAGRDGCYHIQSA